jgi:hypothetical protein
VSEAFCPTAADGVNAMRVALMVLFTMAAFATLAGLTVTIVMVVRRRSCDGRSGRWDSVDANAVSRGATLFVLSMLATATLIGRSSQLVSLVDLALYTMTFGFGAAFVDAVRSITVVSRTVRQIASAAALVLPAAGGVAAGITGLL